MGRKKQFDDELGKLGKLHAPGPHEELHNYSHEETARIRAECQDTIQQAAHLISGRHQQQAHSSSFKTLLGAAAEAAGRSSATSPERERPVQQRPLSPLPHPRLPLPSAPTTSTEDVHNFLSPTPSLPVVSSVNS